MSANDGGLAARPPSRIRVSLARAAPAAWQRTTREAPARRVGARQSARRDASPTRAPARVDPTHARTPDDDCTLASSAVRNVNALLEKRASRRAAATTATAATATVASSRARRSSPRHPSRSRTRTRARRVPSERRGERA